MEVRQVHVQHMVVACWWLRDKIGVKIRSEIEKKKRDRNTLNIRHPSNSLYSVPGSRKCVRQVESGNVALKTKAGEVTRPGWSIV